MYKVFVVHDDGALSRQVVRGRVPGQSEPERLDSKPNWDPIVKGIQYDRVLNTALARQGAIILANDIAEEWESTGEEMASDSCWRLAV